MLKQIIIILSFLFINNTAYSKELNNNFKFKKIDAVSVPDDVPFFDAEGVKHYMEEYEGKTILLVFWASWCSPCVNEMTHLDMLQKDFRKLNFTILPISQDYSGIEIVKQFYKDYDLRHLPVLHDYKNALFKAFEIVGLPTSIIINAEGKAVGIFTGDVPWYDEEVRNILLSYIPGNPVTPKNSHKDQSLNHIINKEEKPESPKKDEPKEEVKIEVKQEEKKIEENPNVK